MLEQLWTDVIEDVVEGLPISKGFSENGGGS